MKVIERCLQNRCWEDDLVLLRIIVGIDHISRHVPFTTIDRLVPLAPAMGNRNFVESLSIFNQGFALVDNLLGISFW